MNVTTRLVVVMPMVVEVTIGTDSQSMIKPISVSLLPSLSYDEEVAKLEIEENDEHMRNIVALYRQGQKKAGVGQFDWRADK